MNEFTKEILMSILTEKPVNLENKTIEGILNNELEKPVEEIDTKLIDLCLTALKEK